MKEGTWLNRGLSAQKQENGKKPTRQPHGVIQILRSQSRKVRILNIVVYKLQDSTLYPRLGKVKVENWREF